MSLTGKNILLISPEAWNHIFVSKHHYAVHLAKRGNRVFFVGPPETGFRLLPTSYVNVVRLTYSSFPIGLRFYPRFLQRYITLSTYLKLEKLAAVRFDVIWSFDNSVFFDFSSLPPYLLKISHIVDHNQDFQTRKAASTADYCFCPTEGIKDTLSQFNERVFKINHGYNKSMAMDVEFVSMRPRRKALYSGNLAIGYIDWVLLSEVIENHPDVDFVFVGPYESLLTYSCASGKIVNMLMKKSNVHFMGRVEYYDLHRHYQTADVLLVAYEEKYQSTQCANTHKMMEYLGSGKVIVATHTSEYMDLHPLLVMSDKNSNWPGLFAKVVANLAFYNSADLQTRRRAFAMDNSYDHQILRIEKIIYSK